LSDDERLAGLRRRLTDVEAQLASTAASSGTPDAGGGARPAGAEMDESPAPAENPDPADLAAQLASRRKELAGAAAKLARTLDEPAGDAVTRAAASLEEAMVVLLEETLPRHALSAGEV